MTTTGITTQEQLKVWYQAWVDGDWYGDKTPNDFVNQYFDSGKSEIDSNGDVWICDPQSGHWADDDAKSRFWDYLKMHKAV